MVLLSLNLLFHKKIKIECLELLTQIENRILKPFSNAHFQQTAIYI